MEALQKLLPLLLGLSLAGLVMTVGLQSVSGDLLYVLRRPKLLLKAFLSVNIIPPVAAGILVWFLPIDPAVKGGIMLMAISPVPPLVPGQELQAGGRKEYAYGLYVAMVLLTIIVVPVIFDLTSRLFGRDDLLTFGIVGKTVLTGAIIPLLIGLLISRLAPKIAKRMAPWIYRLSMLLVVMVFLPILFSIWPAIMSLIGNGTLLAMIALVVITLAAGHLLGGPEHQDRITLAIASSVRHPGIAMMLANASFHDRRVTAAVLLFMLVGMVVGYAYKRVYNRRTARREAA